MRLKDFPAEVTLRLLAVDFRETEYFGCGPCAIEKATKRQFKVNDCTEGVSTLYIGQNDEIRYTHIPYNQKDFDNDSIAASFSQDQTLIREIHLSWNPIY